MELERVLVLSCVDPQSIILQNVRTKIVNENCGIYNCLPVENKAWSEEVIYLLRHWLTLSQEVWFSRMDIASGMLFFRDHQERIINAKTMLAEMKLCKNLSFIYVTQEKKRLAKLKEHWVELHDLKIDYAAEFKIVICATPKRVEKPGPLDAAEPLAKKAKEHIPEEQPAQGGIAEEPAIEDIPVEPHPDLISSSPSPSHSPAMSSPNPEQISNSYKFYPGKDPVYVYGKVHTEPYASLDDVPFPDSLKSSIPRLATPCHVVVIGK